MKKPVLSLGLISCLLYPVTSIGEYVGNGVELEPILIGESYRRALSPVEPIEENEPEEVAIEEEIVVPSYREINVRVSFYTDEDNALEGGKYDRRGRLLASYHHPIVAMPKDVPYGSWLDIDGTLLQVVDTGGAMVWTDSNSCNIDVFIPGKTTEWLNENTGVFYTTAKLYEVEEE